MEGRCPRKPDEWIPDANRSGYAFEISLRIGDEGKPILAWSEDEFVAKLGSIVEEIRAALGKVD